jgi:hypothetical protein
VVDISDLEEVDRSWKIVRDMILDGRVSPKTVEKSYNAIIRNHQSLQELLSCATLQLTNVKGWNEMLNWGLSESDFAELPAPPLTRTGNDPLVTTLMFGHEDVITTLNEWISVIQLHEGWRFHLVEDIKINEESVRLILPENGHGAPMHRQGLYWADIDTKANWDSDIGISPMQCRGEKSAGVEMFGLAGHHPELIKRMGVRGLPQFWIPGLAARNEHYPNWEGALYFGWREPDGIFAVDIRSREDRRAYYSNPIVVKTLPWAT